MVVFIIVSVKIVSNDELVEIEFDMSNVNTSEVSESVKSMRKIVNHIEGAEDSNE